MMVLRLVSLVLALLFALASPSVRAASGNGLPAKPAGLDDPGWASLQQAIGAATGLQARLQGDRSVQGADGATNDQFGLALALSGDTALVGAPFDDVGARANQGSVYVFVRVGSSWALQAKLLAEDGAASDWFGWSVALAGDTALVGAIRDRVGANVEQGSAYVYTRSGTTWMQQAKLVAADGAAGDQFGTAVALSADTALVGARRDDIGANADQGSAYVHVRSDSVWTQQAKLVAADGAAGDLFGNAVALSGDTVLIGVASDDVGAQVDQGSAHVYVRSGSTWTPQAQLLAADGAAGDRLGASVALSGDTALIGADGDDIGAQIEQGSAYVYTRTGVSWALLLKLVASDGQGSDRFGFSVALSPDAALVGAPANVIGAGSAYAYARSGWVQQAKLVAAEGAVDDRLGHAVALSGDTALLGAPFDDIGVNADQGSASMYRRSGNAWAPEAHLSAGTGASNEDWAGVSIALSGDTVLVGVPFDDLGSNSNQGSVFVFVRSGSTWSPQARLIAGDGAADDRFGRSVALDGDTAVVGADQADLSASINGQEGAAYVFVRQGVTWTQQAKLVASDGQPTDVFGRSVAISGDTVLVGAPSDDIGANVNQGSAYVYARAGTTWSQQAKLLATDGAAADWFGAEVAMSGDIALVGASLDDVGANADQGSARVYARSGSAWTPQATLVAVDGAAGDRFGVAVALSGNTALIGAEGVDVGTRIDQGAVYVYTRSDAIWAPQAKLIADDGASGELLGVSVALSGDLAVLGSPFKRIADRDTQGAAYVYRRNGTTWTPQARVVAEDGAAGDFFGTAVAVSGTTAVIGAYAVDGAPPYGNPNEGAAYVYAGVDRLDRVFDDGFESAPKQNRP